MSTTDPYNARADAELAAGPLIHVHEITADHPDWAEPVTLDVDADSGLELVYDEGWAPHVQMTVNTRVPDDADTLAALDPRKGVRLVVKAGYKYADGTTDLHTMADLGLRSRVIVRPENFMELRASGDEALLQDNIWTSSTPGSIPTTGLAEAAAWLIDEGAGAGTTLDSDLPSAYRPDLLTEVIQPTGDDYWSTLAGIVDDAEAWIYDPGDRTFRLTTRPEVAGLSRAQLSVGPGGTITNSESQLDREKWGNAVFLRSKWRDDTGTDRTVIARSWVSTGDFTAGTVGWRWQKIERTSPTTQAASDAAAIHILKRVVSRGRGLSLTAKAAYWLRPGHTVTVQLPTGGQERQIVSRVAFSIPSGLMTVRTRQPEDTTYTNGE